MGGIFSKKGESGFSVSSTAEKEVTQGIDGSGLTAIVTGHVLLYVVRLLNTLVCVNFVYISGAFGVETSRVLALRGVHVVMAVRNMEAGSNIKEAILKEVPNAKIGVMELDLSSLASVRKFATEYTSSGFPLNILIYQKYYAYGQSKLANILHANELTRRLKEEGAEVTANSLHPGTMLTNFMCYDCFLWCLLQVLGILVSKTVEQAQTTHGAATTCFVALHPQVKGVGGKYFVDCIVTKPSSQAKNADLAAKPWDFSSTTECSVALHHYIKDFNGECTMDSNKADLSSQANDAELAKKLCDFSLNPVNLGHKQQQLFP
ncbi:unnamed protein product [Malus baccata var. baccata]